MEREEFIKKRWQGYEIILYMPKRKDGIEVECMLLAVDFENELFQLEPIDKDIYEDEVFWARVEYCKRPPHKLKVVK
jgi:hypothetical protein